jgi:sodium-dependent dicarboxylate transporter 2/3/5
MVGHIATGKFPQMTMVKVGLLINVVLVFVKAFWAWIFWM